MAALLGAAVVPEYSRIEGKELTSVGGRASRWERCDRRLSFLAEVTIRRQVSYSWNTRHGTGSGRW